MRVGVIRSIWVYVNKTALLVGVRVAYALIAILPGSQ